YTIRQRDRETSGDLMKRFFRLAGFIGKKAGPPEEQAKHFKWALCDWILDGIVNTKFTDMAQVANATRNIEILRERSSHNNKRNLDGDCRVATVIRSYDITEVSSITVLLGLQVRKDAWTMPPLLHVTYVGNFIRARHVIGLLELVSLMLCRHLCQHHVPSTATAAIVSAVYQANDHGFGGIRVPKQKRNTGIESYELMIDLQSIRDPESINF
ncbi:hypothetical protein Tco_1154110, partial [Tanacetum coccineum]